MFEIPENHISKNPYVIENTKFCKGEESIMFTTNELQSVYESDRKLQRYEKCLTEIKEIAEKHKATVHCCYLEDMTAILQKINEVEDE